MTSTIAPSISVPVKLLRATSKLPTYGTSEAAGLDLYADFGSGIDYLILEPGQRSLIPAGVSFAIPVKHYGRISPRSGLAYKQGVDVLAGTIDSDFRGELGVILINLGQESIRVDRGDRIAQIIFQRYETALLTEVDELPVSVRGDGGFGSTGR